MAITLDHRASNVIENLRATLDAQTVGATSVKLFSGPVTIVDDVESFVRLADPLKAPPGVSCGVVAGVVQEGDGAIDIEGAIVRLPIEIIIRFNKTRAPGADEKSAVQTIADYSAAVKDAALADRSRGGICGLHVWSGNVINGTEVRGQTRMLRRVPNQAFYTAVVPIACAWSLASPR